MNTTAAERGEEEELWSLTNVISSKFYVLSFTAALFLISFPDHYQFFAKLFLQLRYAIQSAMGFILFFSGQLSFQNVIRTGLNILTLQTV
jgi:hypothetical protein